VTSSDDRGVLDTIDELAEEERQLRDAATGRPLTDEERQQLTAIEERRDQAWDLLRQRRAREEFGEDPSQVRERPTDEVEGYLQ
jgi:Protein of unknown function (DUF2630)